MCDQDLDSRIAPAVEEVLEAMFFSGTLDSAEVGTDSRIIAAQVAFDGESSGVLEIRISEESARRLAASFLGEDEESLSSVAVEQVVCELANMICGAVVSKPKFGGHLSLGSPRLVPALREDTDEVPVSRQDFAVENGMLSVLLYTGANA